MRILTTLTYYTPHISGLTVYAARVADGLIKRGHHVTVVTSHYGSELPRHEWIDGVEVIRPAVWARIGKGVLMPSYHPRVAQLLREHDLLYLHLPQLEASAVAAYGRFIARKPVVTTYHCDIELPEGPARHLFSGPISLSHHLTARSSHRIVVNSDDYADGSRFLSRYRKKVVACYPPCPPPVRGECEPLNVRERFGLGQGPIVAFLGRFAEDKGVQHLIDAVPEVLRSFPNAHFVLAGQREKVFGERVYERLEPKIAALGDRLVFPGQLPSGQLAEFLADCSILVVPSVNSTESFGMVQVEAMHCGTPVVASDLPGVRVPVRASGMGEIAPPADPASLAAAIVKVLSNRDRYVKPPGEIASLFDAAKTIDFYEELFSSLIESKDG